MKVKINKMQYFFMLPNLIYAKAIGVTSGVVVRKIGADAWTSMLIGFIIGTMAVVLMVYIGSKFPEKTVIQYSEELLGKWPSKFIGFLLFIFFALAYTTSANVLLLHITEYFLPQTPFYILCILFTLICTYGVILGIEVIIRFAFFGFIMTMGINIAMLTGTIKDFRIINLQPFFDRGITENIMNSIYVFGDVAMAILAVAMIYPMVNSKKKVIPLTIISMLLGIISVIIWPFFETGVLGADVMKQFTVVCMQQIRSAQLSRYLPRYELIMVSFFVWGLYVQSAVMFYCSIYSLKQVTGIKKDWYMVLPISVMLIIITYITGYDDNKFVNYMTYPWPQICLALSLGLPIILFLAMILRGKLKKEKQYKNKEISNS